MDQGSIKPEMFRLHARQARTIDSADDISREATLDRTDKISCALSAFYDACHSFQLNQLDGHGVIKVNRSNGAHPPFFDPTPLYTPRDAEPTDEKDVLLDARFGQRICGQATGLAKDLRGLHALEGRQMRLEPEVRISQDAHDRELRRVRLEERKRFDHLAARLCSVERDENKQRTSELLQSVRANFADEIARVKVEAKCHLDAERARVDELLAGMRADNDRRTELTLADVRLRLDADSRDGHRARERAMECRHGVHCKRRNDGTCRYGHTGKDATRQRADGNRQADGARCAHPSTEERGRGNVSQCCAPTVSPSKKAVTKAVNTAKVEKPVRRLQLQYGSAKPRSRTVISRIQAVANKSVGKALTSSFYDKHGKLQLYTQGMLNQDIKNDLIVLIAVQPPVISVMKFSKPDTSRKVFSSTLSERHIVGANEKSPEAQQPRTSPYTPLEHDCAYAAWIKSHQVSIQSGEMPTLNGADAFGDRTVDEMRGRIPEMKRQLSINVVPGVMLRGSREASSPVLSAPTAKHKVVLDSETVETMMEEENTMIEEKMFMTDAVTAAPTPSTVVPAEPTRLMGAPDVGRVTDEEPVTADPPLAIKQEHVALSSAETEAYALALCMSGLLALSYACDKANIAFPPPAIVNVDNTAAVAFSQPSGGTGRTRLKRIDVRSDWVTVLRESGKDRRANRSQTAQQTSPVRGRSAPVRGRDSPPVPPAMRMHTAEVMRERFPVIWTPSAAVRGLPFRTYTGLLPAITQLCHLPVMFGQPPDMDQFAAADVSCVCSV